MLYTVAVELGKGHTASFVSTFLTLTWLKPGPKANTVERKAAMAAAQQFIKEKGYSNKTQVNCLALWQNNTFTRQHEHPYI